MISLQYRPDIDGLRAISVIAVVGYHAFPDLVPGGFVGVDVFFVISGYLITSIIDRQILIGNFSIVIFYTRRVLRIVPALVVVLYVTFVIGWFVLPASRMETFGATIKGAVGFAENFVLHEQLIGYFYPGADRLPLLHLWSLAIEEQYYIVWPAVLLLICRFSQRQTTVVAALAIGSFLLCVSRSTTDSNWAFYSPTTRGWELLAGSWLALWNPDRFGPKLFRIQTLIASVAFAGLIGSLFIFNDKSPWPGVRTIAPVLITIALIATSNTIIHRLLIVRWLVFIGLISYPLYLWHFPVLAFAKLHVNGSLPAQLKFALLTLSFLLAWLTYRFIERPIRFGASALRLRAALPIGAMIGAWLIGFVAVETQGLPIRFPQSIRGFMLSGSETNIHWRRGKCLLLLQPSSEFAPECAGEGGRPLLLIWGDSYAAAFYPGLQHFASNRNYHVAQYTASACPPLIGFSLPERPFCKSINDDILTRISQLRPDVVILDATWGQAASIVRQNLPHTIAALKNMNITRIIIMGPPPGWQGYGLPTNVSEYYRETQQILPARTFYRSTDEWTRGRDTLLRELSHKLAVQYISVRNVFCNDNGCLTRIGPSNSQLTAFDPGHLTVPASIYLAEKTLDYILDTRSSRHSGSGWIPR